MITHMIIILWRIKINMEEKYRGIRKFGIIDKLAYMSGDVANDLSFVLVSMYLLVFYTNVLGIDGSIVGILFLTARIVDAFTDVGMGRIVDGFKPRKEGKFRFWIKAAAPFVSFSSFLLFVYVVKDFPMYLKILYIFVTYIFWGSICYTAVNIPYGSMASVISEKSEHRASLSVFRSIGANISILIISYIVPKVVFVEQLVNGKAIEVISPKRFTLLALIFSIIAFCFYMFCYTFSIERVQLPFVKKEKKSSGLAEAKKLINSLTKNKPLQAFVLLSLVFLLTTMLNNGLATYIYIDYFKNKDVLSYSGMIGAILTFVISLFASNIVKIVGKKVSGTIGLLLTGIIFIVLNIMRLSNAYTFFWIFVVASIGVSYFNIIIWAFISDIIDDQQLRTGTREDGTVYAIYSFARKLGQALAGGLTGFVLSFIGYKAGVLVQTEAVREKIYSIFTSAQAIGYILCALILFFIYPLNKKKIDANIEALKKIRGEDE